MYSSIAFFLNLVQHQLSLTCATEELAHQRYLFRFSLAFCDFVWLHENRFWCVYSSVTYAMKDKVLVLTYPPELGGGGGCIFTN